MGSFAQARALAEKWVDLSSEGAAELVRESTIAKPYGWVFFWESKAALRDPGRVSARLAGNAPFVVFRDSLELKVLGTAFPVAHFLEELERHLPEAALRRRAEQPTW
jgi:immunity protein 35 of polymorphic toxin system